MEEQEQKEEIKIKDWFKVRATNPEQNSWIITIGNCLATRTIYETKEDAENELNAVNWDLVGCIAKIIAEATIKTEENNKESKD